MCNWPESTTSLFIASVFAENMGFIAEDLTTNNSVNIFLQWLKGNCQPNYRKVCVCIRMCVFLVLVGYRHAASKRLILSWEIDRHTKVAHKVSFCLKVMPNSTDLLQFFKPLLFFSPVASPNLQTKISFFLLSQQLSFQRECAVSYWSDLHHSHLGMPSTRTILSWWSKASSL